MKSNPSKLSKPANQNLKIHNHYFTITRSHPGIVVSLTCTTYRYSTLRGISLILLFTFLLAETKSQNLVANPGFEDINNCTEYHSDCGIEAWFNIPPVNTLVKYRAAPVPVLGHNFLVLPIENILEKPVNRGVVYTMLLCPLMAGKRYKFSFFLNTSGRKFYHLDFCFLSTEPNIPGFRPTDLVPAFSITDKDLDTDFKLGWKIIEHEFIAAGDDNFLVIGNFSTEKIPYVQKDAMNSLGDVLCFIDELVLKAVDPVPLCNNYAKRQEELYEQNYRHTEFVKVQKETPVPKEDQFITDTIIIPAVLFKTNSAAVKMDFYKMLDSICKKFQTQNISRIEITGHTDNTGTPQRNEQLSRERAEAIKQYISKQLPLLEPLMAAQGKASSFPVADNTTTEGRQQNRRVEIVVTRLNKAGAH